MSLGHTDVSLNITSGKELPQDGDGGQGWGRKWGQQILRILKGARVALQAGEDSAHDFKGGVVKFLLAATDASKKSNSLFVPGMKGGIVRRKNKEFS